MDVQRRHYKTPFNTVFDDNPFGTDVILVQNNVWRKIDPTILLF